MGFIIAVLYHRLFNYYHIINICLSLNECIQFATKIDLNYLQHV